MLVLCPSDVAGITAATVVAGLSLERRITLAAARAGWQPLPLHASEALDRPSAAIPARRVLLLSTAVVPRTEWLRRLRETPLEPGRLYTDGTAVAMMEGAQAGGIVAAARRCAGMRETVATLSGLSGPAHGLPDGAGRFVLTGGRDLPEAERWLLRGLIKPTEGFMSRHVERKISLALTRQLCRTRVTPNAVTLVSLAIGLAGAPFFLSAAPRYQITGALLFLAHSILDGCDGELARLKFLESRAGALLDIVGDNLVHAAVFACMAAGWTVHSHSPWPLLLGAVAVVSTLAIAAVVYGRGMRASREGGPVSRLSRVADAVVYRDFIYLIVLLAAVGKAHWFVGLTAVGAPLFLIVLAWLGRASSHRG